MSRWGGIIQVREACVASQGRSDRPQRPGRVAGLCMMLDQLATGWLWVLQVWGLHSKPMRSVTYTYGHGAIR